MKLLFRDANIGQGYGVHNLFSEYLFLKKVNSCIFKIIQKQQIKLLKVRADDSRKQSSRIIDHSSLQSLEQSKYPSFLQRKRQ